MITKNIPEDRIQEYANEVASSGWLAAYRENVAQALSSLNQAKYDLESLGFSSGCIEEAIKNTKQSRRNVETFLFTNTVIDDSSEHKKP